MISYAHHSRAWPAYQQRILSLIAENNVRDVLDIGGGANPSLEPSQIMGLNYYVLDISQAELDKTPSEYKTICCDILKAVGQFDLVVSKMFCEHVCDGEALHRKVFDLLRPGGLAFHFFPTLYAPSMLLNRLLPESATSRAVSALFPHRASNGNLGKFPAYYSWCRGPSRRQIKRFERIGYCVEECVGFFGTDYLRSIPALQSLSDLVASVLVRHPITFLTSDCFLLLRKRNPIFRPSNVDF